MITGYALLMIGAIMMMVAPIERTAAHRRSVRAIASASSPMLLIDAPDRDFDALVRRADAALEADALNRGLVGLTEVYVTAAVPRRDRHRPHP